MLVDSLFQDHRSLLAFLQESGEISFASTLQVTMPKIVLLAGASYLEDRIQGIIIEFFDEVTGAHTEGVAFVRNKAIKRQYHTYFEWDKGSANPFFGLFGTDCLRRYKDQLKADPNLAENMKAFCRLGSLRNQLIHGNYASFSLQQTAEEVYSLYQAASNFVEVVPAIIRSPRAHEDDAADVVDQV